MTANGRRLVLDLPFERAVSATVQALNDEGFETITRVDVREMLRRTLGHESRRYVLLGVSAPELVLAALRLDLDVGVQLPTQIAIYEIADGETVVSLSEPFGAYLADRQWQREQPELMRTVATLNGRLAAAVDRLSRKATTIAEPPLARAG